MEAIYAIVIDKNGHKSELVLAEKQKSGESHPVLYALKNDESLVFEGISTAISMIMPRWTGSKWIETATLSEIEAAKPPEQPATISESDRISAVEQAILTLALGGSLDV